MTYLFVHIISLLSHYSSREQPGNTIEFRGFDSWGPNLWVLVAKEDVALVELDGAGESTRPEVQARETELGVTDGSIGSTR